MGFFDRIDRRMQVLDKQIAEEKRRAKPLTEQQFNDNDHLKNGRVVGATTHARKPGMPKCLESWELLERAYQAALLDHSDRLDGVRK